MRNVRPPLLPKSKTPGSSTNLYETARFLEAVGDAQPVVRRVSFQWSLESSSSSFNSREAGAERQEHAALTAMKKVEDVLCETNPYTGDLIQNMCDSKLLDADATDSDTSSSDQMETDEYQPMFTQLMKTPRGQALSQLVRAKSYSCFTTGLSKGAGCAHNRKSMSEVDLYTLSDDMTQKYKHKSNQDDNQQCAFVGRWKRRLLSNSTSQFLTNAADNKFFMETSVSPKDGEDANTTYSLVSLVDGWNTFSKLLSFQAQSQIILQDTEESEITAPTNGFDGRLALFQSRDQDTSVMCNKSVSLKLDAAQLPSP